MKKILVAPCVVLVATSLAWSAPSGLRLLSEQHHVWGEAGTDSTQPGEFPGGVHESYDVAASHPVSGSAEGIEVFSPFDVYPVTASSRAGSFSVEAHGVRWTGWGYADSAYVFQPEEGTKFLAMDASGWRSGHPFELTMELTLTDLTTATRMERFIWPDGSWEENPEEYYWGDDFAWRRTYPVDPSHTYGLHLYTDAYGGDMMSDTYMEVGLSSAVPAPGAVLLGALGTGLVGWLRRRRVV